MDAAASPWNPPAVVIAACALGFTVASFWWIHARRGRLKTFEPHTFAAVLTRDRFQVRLPLVFYNTGAKPIIVQNLRARLLAQDGSTLGVMAWHSTCSQLMPDPTETHVFPAVVSFEGRKAQELFVQFWLQWEEIQVQRVDYSLRVEVKLSHKAAWIEILRFTLHAGHILYPGRFITYSNDPTYPVNPHDRQLADKEWEKLGKPSA